MLVAATLLIGVALGRDPGGGGMAWARVGVKLALTCRAPMPGVGRQREGLGDA